MKLLSKRLRTDKKKPFSAQRMSDSGHSLSQDEKKMVSGTGCVFLHAVDNIGGFLSLPSLACGVFWEHLVGHYSAVPD